MLALCEVVEYNMHMETKETKMILPSLLDTYTLTMENAKGYTGKEDDFFMWCHLCDEVEHLTGHGGLAAEKIVGDTMVAMKVWKRENL